MMLDREAKEALDNRVWASLPPVLMALTALYVVFTISHSLLLPAQARVPMVVIAGSTAIVFFCFALGVRRVEALKKRSYPIAFFAMVLVSTNSSLHIYLTHDIVHTTNVMFVILGSGFLMLSLGWYVLTLVVTLGSWILAVLGITDQSLFVHFAFALFSATLASLVFRLVHVRDLIDNHHLRMVSESQRQRMEHLATHDSLTGLANRRKFHETLELETAHLDRSGRKLAVLYLDLDRFKQLNDRHGHAYGDEVLKAFAAGLRELTRETDLACRLGGDEFAILLTGLKEVSDADIVVSKVLERFAEPVLINEISTRITLSVGKAVLPDEADRLDELLRLADRRMYSHKGSALREREV